MFMETKITLEPLFKRVIVEYFEENPHRQKITAGGILIPSQSFGDIITNREKEAIVDGGDKRIAYGIIREIAVDCVTSLKVGDEVIFDLFQGMPLALAMSALKVIPETAVIAVIRKEQ